MNNTIYASNDSVIDLQQYGPIESAKVVISGTDFKLIYPGNVVVNVVNGAMFSSLEKNNLVFKFNGKDVSGETLLKSVDLSNLELERIDSSLSEQNNEFVLKDNIGKVSEKEAKEIEAQQQEEKAREAKELAKAKKEAAELKEEAEKMLAEAEEARNASAEIQDQLEEFLNDKTQNKAQNGAEGPTEGDDPEALGFKLMKKKDADSVAEAARLKLSDSTGSSNSSGTSNAEEVPIEIIPIDITLKLDQDSDSGVKNDNITNITTPTFVGSTEPGMTVTLRIDGIVAAVAVADEMGNFSFELSSPLSEGKHNVQVDVSDGQGGSGTAKIIVTIDTIIEPPTFELEDQYAIPAADRIEGENLTRFKDARIVGEAEAGATVEIFVNGKLLATVTSNADGKWSYKFSASELSEGTNNIEIVATDKAGNTASTPGFITLDTIPPEIPVIDLLASSDSGTEDDDDLTNIMTPAFSGTSEPGTRLELYLNGYKVADIEADERGNWNYTLPANKITEDGVYTFEVVSYDRAGNSSSAALDVTVDTDIDLFTIAMDAASDSGVVGDNYTNERYPSFTGKTDSLSVIVVTNLTTGETFTINASQSGNFSFTLGTASHEGLNELEFVVTDYAGNTETFTFEYTVDTIPPDQPTVELDEFVVSQSGDILTKDTTPTFTGTAEPGSTITLTIDGRPYPAVIVGPDGTWSLTVPSEMRQGSYAVQVIATDKAGNPSEPADYPFVLDTETSRPIANLIAEDDTGFSQTDWITKINDSLTMQGTAEKYTTINIMVDGKSVGTVYADADGKWEFTYTPFPSLSNQTYVVTFEATDEVGNKASSSYDLVIDTIIATPTLRLDPSSDSGDRNDDGVTKENTPLLNGTAEAGSLVEIFVDGRKVGAVTADKDGNWSYRITEADRLTDGPHNISVKSTDVAGNEADSSVLNIVIDSVIEKPTIVLQNDSGDDAHDGITRHPSPILIGTAEPDSLVVIYRDGQLVTQVRANAQGEWSYSYPADAALEDGEYHFYVTSTDLAGNSATSDTIKVVIDQIVSAPVIALDEASDSATKGDNITNIQTPTFNISTDPDVIRVMVSIDNGPPEEATRLPNGQWIFTSGTLDHGFHNIVVSVTDKAGNTNSNSLRIEVDTELSVPTIALDPVSDTGESSRDNVTNDPNPIFKFGNIDSDVTRVQVFIGSTPYEAEFIEGAWHFQASELPHGVYNIKVVVTDKAGNTQESAVLVIDVDRELSKPVITLTTDSGTPADNITKTDPSSFAIDTDADVVKVTVWINGQPAGTATQDAEGKWSYTAETLGDGEHTIEVRIEDKAGNTESQTLKFTIDKILSQPTIALNAETDSGQYDNDGVTKNTVPKFNLGSIDDDVNKVVVKINGVSYPVNINDIINGVWTYNGPPLTHNDYTVTVEVTDVAGNVRTSEEMNFTVDLNLNKPVIVLVDAAGAPGENLIPSDKPTFSIETDTDVVSVMVRIDGGTLIAASKDRDGVWSFTSGSLTHGNHTIEVLITDLAGNENSDTMNFVVDNQLSTPTIALDALSDTGESSSDGITNARVPTFVLGSIDPDVTSIVIKINGQSFSLTLADLVNGTWTYTGTPLVEDDYTVTVEVTDAAGNHRISSPPLTFSVDLRISEPVVTLENDTGVRGDFKTNSDKPGINIATDEDVVKVQVSIDGGSKVDAIMLENGLWTFTSEELPDGIYTFKVDITDRAGNTSSKSVTIEVDTALSTPTVALASGSDTGEFDHDNLTNDRAPRFRIAPIDSDVTTIQVLVNGVPYNISPEDIINGEWQYSGPLLEEKEYTVTVKVTDEAGNERISQALTFTVDLTLSAPIIVLISDSGTPGDNKTNNATPRLDITTDKDVYLVEVSLAGQKVPVVKDAEGKWHIVSDQLTHGFHTFEVIVTDRAGNTNSSQLTIEVDLQVSQPTVALDANSDTGRDNNDNITRENKPTFVLGNIDPDVIRVVVTINGTAYEAANVAGQWTFTYPESQGLRDGTHTVSVTVYDDAENTSTSKELTFVVDRSLTAPIITLLDDTGADTSDGITNVASPKFAIATDPDVYQVMVSINGAARVPATVKPGVDGQWEFTAANLQHGKYEIEVFVTDIAGNTQSHKIKFEVDLEITKPTIELNAASDTGESQGDNLTKEKVPTFKLSGLDPDLHSIVINVNGVNYSLTPTNIINGEWRYTGPALNDGVHNVKVTVTDIAGNTITSDNLVFEVDTAINKPAIALDSDDDTGVKGDNKTNVTTPKFNIAVDPDVYLVMVSIDGGQAVRATKNPDGSWSYISSTLGDGNHVVVVTATDKAGNESSETLSIVVDIMLNKPTLVMDALSDTGMSDSDGITKTLRPTFNIGNIDSDVVKIQLIINGKTYDVPLVAGATSYRYTMPNDMDLGTYPVEVRIEDAAGNVSSETIQVTIDTSTSVDGITLIDDSGVVGDWITNVKTAQFKIDAPSDAHTVQIKIAGQTINAIRDEVSGDWYFNLPSGLADNEYTITVTVTDKAGNQASQDQKFELDTTLEKAVVTLSSADDTGVVGDNKTKNTTPTFEITNIPADIRTVEILLNGVTTTLTVKADRTWTFTAPPGLRDGEYPMKVILSDIAGNRVETDYKFTIDTTVTIDSIILTNDSGDSPTDGITNASQPEFLVTVPDDVRTMTATINGMVCVVVKNSAGQWTVKSPVLTQQGEYTLRVEVEDEAGNITFQTKTIIFDSEVNTPNVAMVAADDTGHDKTDGLTNKKRPSFEITNVDSDVTKVLVTLNGETIEVFKDANGKYIFKPANDLRDDTYTFTVEVSDLAGNKASREHTFEVDSTLTTPTIVMHKNSDTGRYDDDGLTKTKTPQFVITGIDDDAYSVVINYRGNNTQIYKNTNGEWLFTVPSTEQGTYTINVTVTDHAGNVREDSMEFTIDTEVTIHDIIMSDDTGYDNQDCLTNDRTPEFEIVVPNDVYRVTAKLNSGAEVDVQAINGKFIFKITNQLNAGSHKIIFTAYDEAGNSVTQEFNFIVDYTVNAVVIDMRDSDDSGSSNQDNYTNNKRPTFLFTSIDSDVHSLKVNYNGLDYDVDLAARPIAFRPPADLIDGNYTLTVTITDKAGNTNTSTLDFTIDTQTSVEVEFMPGFDTGFSSEDGITNNNKPKFEIKVPADVEKVTVWLEGVSYPVSKVDGKWIFETPVLQDKEYVLRVEVEDKAGNKANTELEFTIDSTLSTPTIELDVASDTGFDNKDRLTNDKTPKFILGNIDSDYHSVTVTIGNTTKSAELKNGVWSFTVDARDELTHGKHTVTVKVEDKAGNIRTQSIEIDVDLECPPPVVSLADASDSGNKGDNVTKEPRPTINIAGAPGDLDKVIIKWGTQTFELPANTTSWKFPSNLPDGNHTVTVTFRDKAGNESPTSYTVTIDKTVTAPTVELLDDTGRNTTDKITNNPRPRIEIGAGEELVKVTVIINGTRHTITQDGSGKWIYTDAYTGDAVKTIKVEMEDVAGNVHSEDFTFEVDTRVDRPTLVMDSASDTGASNSDNLTKNNKPRFIASGVNSDVDTLYLEVDGGRYEFKLVNGVWSVTPTSPLNDGEHTVKIIITDIAGNTAENTIKITIDTKIVLTMDLEADSDSGFSQTDKLTNVTTPTFSGTTDKDATLTIKVLDANGATVQTYTTKPKADGSWSIKLTDLAQGDYRIIVDSVDLAGNTAKSELSFTIDTEVVAPSVRLTSPDPEDNNLAISLTPEFSGTGEPGAKITINIDGRNHAVVTVNSSGTWSWTPPSALPSGPSLMKVTAEDRAGNISQTYEFAFTIPLVNVDPPTMQLTNDTDSGAIGDFITNKPSPVITGVTLPGAVVTIYLAGVAVSTVTTDSIGRYSYNLGQLPEGTYSLQVGIINPLDGQEVRSPRVDLVMDFKVEPGSWAINGINSEGYINVKTPVISGKTEPGAKIEVYVDGVWKAMTMASNDGSWMMSIPNIGSDGTYAIRLKITDIAGNVHDTPTKNVIVDTELVQVTVKLRTSDDTGSNNSDNITNKSRVTLEGTAEANSIITIYNRNNIKLGSVKANAQGSWSYAVTLTEGTQNFKVVSADAAGNSNEAHINIVLDTQIELSEISLHRDSNTGDKSDLITSVKRPTIVASTDGNSIVEIYVDGRKVGSVKANASGLVSWTMPDYGDGSYEIHMVATDIAGNKKTGVKSTVVIDSKIDNFTVDPLGALLNERALEFSGTGEVGATITIYLDGKLVANSVVGANGRWNASYIVKSDGSYELTVKIVDIAGNEKSSLPYTFEVDSVTATPTFKLADASNSGSKDDAITNVKRPTIEGTGEAGAVIFIYVDERVVGSVTVNGSGKWTYQFASDLNDGEHGIRVKAVDKAGNEADSTRLVLTIDTKTNISLIEMVNDTGRFSDDYITNSKRPVFRIDGELNQPVKVFVNGVELETFIMTSRDHRWTLPAGYEDGTHTIYFVITDAAGNTARTPEKSFTIDSVNDTPVVLAQINGQDIADFTNGGKIYINDVSRGVELGGTAEARSYVTISINGFTIGEARVDGSGKWSLSVDPMLLSEGVWAVTIASNDVAGNRKAERFEIIIDTSISQFSAEVRDDKETVNGKWVVNHRQVNFNGVGEVGALVTLMVAGLAVGSAAVGEDGKWQMSVPINEGTHGLEFVIRDKSGNTETIRQELIVDSSAPDAPQIDISTWTERGNLWVLAGKAEAGTTIIIKNEFGQTIDRVSVDGNGNWKTAFNYPNGGKISVTVEDIATNSSAPVVLDVNFTPPVIALDAASDGSTIGDGVATTNTPTFIFSNIESDVLEVKVTINGVTVNANKVQDGEWSVTWSTPLDEGSHNVGVSLVDATSTANYNWGFSVDTSVTTSMMMHEPDSQQDQPVKTGLALVDVQEEDLYSGAQTMVEVETAQPAFEFVLDAQVTEASVDLDGVAYSLMPAATGPTVFEVPVPLEDGPHALVLHTQDSQGNTEQHNVAFTVDTSTSSIVASMDASRQSEDAPEFTADNAAPQHAAGFAAQMMSISQSTEEHHNDQSQS